MVQILVDDAELPIEHSALGTISELVEYVKSSIDPDAIILSLTKDDEPLSEADWKCPLSSFSKSLVRITTGSRSTFYQDRLQLSGAISETLIATFRDIADHYKTGRQNSAHEVFATSLEDLNAYVGWLYSILSMDEVLFKSELEKFGNLIDNFKKTCLKLQQEQISQSWSAIGDVLELQVIASIDQCNEVGASALSKVLS
ncbi:MAG TPA: hypothetical protein PKA63_03105 [Oligoflexia bacterium]|nr:hypothetical protein [Oligoflexia bacterium]HMP47643.1 hypothetical protein [Oligoflexia bacterium]